MSVTESRAWMSGSESEAFVFNINHGTAWPRPPESLGLLSGHRVLQTSGYIG